MTTPSQDVETRYPSVPDLETLVRSDAEEALPEDAGDASINRWIPVGVWAVLLVANSFLVGLPGDPVLVTVWIWLGAVAWNAGQPWSVHLQFLKDWAAPLVLLMVYLWSKNVVDELGRPVEYDMPLEVDLWLGGGVAPTQRLQDAWCGGDCTTTAAGLHDVIFFLVYTSHYVGGLALAGVLWVASRTLFKRWMLRYVLLNFIGLTIYFLYPMAPPWLAAEEGLRGADFERLTNRGLELVGLERMGLAVLNAGNPVAAMPSLHTAVCVLVTLWIVTRSISPWRWAALLYPASMSLALVYFADHYTIDIAAGLLLAVLVHAGCSWGERRRSRRATQAAFAGAGPRNVMEAGPEGGLEAARG